MKLFLYSGIRLGKRQLDAFKTLCQVTTDAVRSHGLHFVTKMTKKGQTVHSLCEVQRNGIYAKFNENSSNDFTNHFRLVQTRGRMN
jgi:hypothetical protein